MLYEIREPKTAQFFFWHPDGIWLDVVAAGDLGIRGWVGELRRAGFCICTLRERLKEGR